MRHKAIVWYLCGKERLFLAKWEVGCPSSYNNFTLLLVFTSLGDTMGASDQVLYFLIILTGLWASIRVTRSYSNRPFLYALGWMKTLCNHSLWSKMAVVAVFTGIHDGISVVGVVGTLLPLTHQTVSFVTLRLKRWHATVIGQAGWIAG